MFSNKEGMHALNFFFKRLIVKKKFEYFPYDIRKNEQLILCLQIYSLLSSMFPRNLQITSNSRGGLWTRLLSSKKHPMSIG